MFTSNKCIYFAAAIIATALFMFTNVAYADNYQLHALTTANANNLYGIDQSGDVVVLIAMGGCSGPFTPCYDIFSRTGSFIGAAATAPSLAYDNGGPCTGALPPGFSILNASKCNNGREVFGGEYDNSALAITLCSGPVSGAEITFCNNHGTLIGVFTGFDPFADFIGGVSGDGIDLNAAGDFGLVSGLNEEIYVATDLTQVPEPNTFGFVGAGYLSLFALIRRKMRR